MMTLAVKRQAEEHDAIVARTLNCLIGARDAIRHAQQWTQIEANATPGLSNAFEDALHHLESAMGSIQSGIAKAEAGEV